MKQTLLVAIASAAIGAATAAVLTDRPPPAVRTTAPARLNEAALEGAFVRALETMGFGRQARSVMESPPAPTAEERPPADPGAAPPTVRRSATTESLPPANLEVIRTLKSFDKDEELRRAWMFRSEREVIEWLGMPHHAFAYGGGERWVYRLPDRKERVLEFHRGRLLNIYD